MIFWCVIKLLVEKSPRIAIFWICRTLLKQEDIYKLYKHQSNVNAYKYFFCNRICDTWNALPHTVVEAPSLNTFKRLLNNVAVCHVAVLP